MEGALLEVNDYNLARAYLRKILSMVDKWYSVEQEFSNSKKPTKFRPEWKEKYINFAQAADVLLRNIP